MTCVFWWYKLLRILFFPVSRAAALPIFADGVTIMDLGAFLSAGQSYPVVFEEASALHRRPILGLLRVRRGRPFWSAEGPPPSNVILSLTISLRGFVLEGDESLRPAGPDDAAGLVLAGRLRGSRYFSHLRGYALHLDLLGRVLSNNQHL